MSRLLLLSATCLALVSFAAQAEDIAASFADDSVSASSLEGVRGRHVASGLKDAIAQGVGGGVANGSVGASMESGNASTGGQHHFTDNQLDGGGSPVIPAAAGNGGFAGGGQANSGSIRDGMLGLVTGAGSGAVGPR